MAINTNFTKNTYTRDIKFKDLEYHQYFMFDDKLFIRIDMPSYIYERTHNDSDLYNCFNISTGCETQLDDDTIVNVVDIDSINATVI